jgi:general secretion pathway protein J
VHRPGRDDGCSADAGFTLIEVLVSLVLLALVLALLAGGVRFARGTWDAAARLEEQTGADMAEASGMVRVVFHGAAGALSFVAPAPNGPAGAALYRYGLEIAAEAGPGRGALVVKLAPYRARQTETGAEWAVQSHVLVRNVASLTLRYFGRSRPGAEPAWHAAWTRTDATPNLVELRIGRNAAHGGPVALVVTLRLQTVTR